MVSGYLQGHSANGLKKQTSFEPMLDSDMFISPDNRLEYLRATGIAKYLGGGINAAISDFSRITPKDKEQALSNFCDDMKLMDMLGSAEKFGEGNY